MQPEIPAEAFEVFATGLDHPECIAFDRDGNLWAGGEAGQVYRIKPDGHVDEITNLGGFNAGLAFSRAGDLYVCNSRRGVVRVKTDGRHEVFADRAGEHRLVYVNFPAFASDGRLYVSDSGHWKKRDGCLLRFDPEGRGEVVAGPLGYANGLALSADERVLFMAESDTARIMRFELRGDGALGTPELYAESVGRMPDGLALAADGSLYVACYASDEIWRINTARKRALVAHDPFAIALNRPTNIAFRDKWMYVANLGRYTITRARIDR